MTEQRPVYHADLAGLATERRRAMTDAALLAFVIAPGLAYQWRTRRRGRP